MGQRYGAHRTHEPGRPVGPAPKSSTRARLTCIEDRSTVIERGSRRDLYPSDLLRNCLWCRADLRQDARMATDGRDTQVVLTRCATSAAGEAFMQALRAAAQ